MQYDYKSWWRLTSTFQKCPLQIFSVYKYGVISDMQLFQILFASIPSTIASMTAGKQAAKIECFAAQLICTYH